MISVLFAGRLQPTSPTSRSDPEIRALWKVDGKTEFQLFKRSVGYISRLFLFNDGYQYRRKCWTFVFDCSWMLSSFLWSLIDNGLIMDLHFRSTNLLCMFSWRCDSLLLTATFLRILLAFDKKSQILFLPSDLFMYRTISYLKFKRYPTPMKKGDWSWSMVGGRWQT